MKTIVLAICVGAVALSGCATAKSMGAVVKDLGKGISEDAQGCCRAMQKADTWIRDNAW